MLKLSLTVDENQLLQTLYTNLGIATDRLLFNSVELQALTDRWNRLTGRNDIGSDLLHYMITLRKRKNWVKLTSFSTVSN